METSKAAPARTASGTRRKVEVTEDVLWEQHEAAALVASLARLLVRATTERYYLPPAIRVLVPLAWMTRAADEAERVAEALAEELERRRT